jgi:hypothetical protein
VGPGCYQAAPFAKKAFSNESREYLFVAIDDFFRELYAKIPPENQVQRLLIKVPLLIQAIPSVYTQRFLTFNPWPILGDSAPFWLL